MKKIAIVILILVIAFSFSCKKEGQMVKTTINGQLRTNGTQDPIKVNIELDKPLVTIYQVIDQKGYTSSGYEEIASTKVDNGGNFSITVDLKEGGTFFYGVSNLDTTMYFSGEAYHYWNGFYNYHYNRINAGSDNTIYPYCLAKSWVRPRFINTNPDPNNNDVFKYVLGLPCDNCSSGGIPPIFYGLTDSTLNWVGKTWSGTYKYGLQQPGMTHKVLGKLTRNGVTTDVEIEYFAPPFDTSIVEIRY